MIGNYVTFSKQGLGMVHQGFTVATHPEETEIVKKNGVTQSTSVESHIQRAHLGGCLWGGRRTGALLIVYHVRLTLPFFVAVQASECSIGRL